MVNRLRALVPARFELFALIEAGITGMMFVQAIRFLIGMLYSRTASSSLVASLSVSGVSVDASAAVEPAAFSNEIALLGVMLALPLLSFVVGRLQLLFPLLVGVMGLGRLWMIEGAGPVTPTIAAEIVIGAGFLYCALIIKNRATVFPYLFILGIAADQVLRVFGNTLDPTLRLEFQTAQVVISVVAFLIAILAFIFQRSRSGDSSSSIDQDRGTLTLWAGIGFGAQLFLQLALLALPNAVAGRADADYTTFAPAVVFATLLPLVPAVRSQMRKLIAPFDSGTRGYIWLIIIALLLVIGTRVPRVALAGFSVPVGAVALVIAQFTASMLWWWFVRPQQQNERSFTGLWLIIGTLIFSLFVVCDIFTYEYAFVRNFAPPLDSLNAVIIPLLRGFRGLGLGLLLVATLLATVPMIQATRRVPWTGHTNIQSAFMLLVVIVFTGSAAAAVRPPVIQPVVGVSELRVGTYNIHSGYSEFYEYDLEAIARTISQSGAQVVLLQEVDMGRMTSFGVDQSLWLARRLGMDRRFYATNEGLQGLAVLSRVPIVFDDGELLTSIDQQTGIQRVQIRPDQGVITLYNTNLGLLLAGDTQEEQERNQRRQLSEILNLIEIHIEQDYGGQLGRTILGGTFNNIPDSPLIDTLRQTGFVDPFAGSNPSVSATYVRADTRARIDYLWLWRQSLSAIGNNVIESSASDHRMAIVGVQIE